MYILAGIDEAGLGPTLGPLATAAAALEVPDAWREDTPWEALGGVLVREWRKKETRLAVADSKVLYRTGGLAIFEKTLGAFSFLAHGEYPLRFSFADAEAPRHPCYAPTLAPFPAYAAAVELEGAVQILREALAESVAPTEPSPRVAHLGVDCLFEPALNRRFAAGLNKNQALLMETGRHLKRLAELFPDSPIIAVVDKQGGRDDYAAFLFALFRGAWLDVLEVGRGCSRYRLRREGGDFQIVFKVKADAVSFPTALASMAAKYVRERFMAGLNAWFAGVCPGLQPTAGYYVDAARWLGELRTRGLMEKGQVSLLVRER